ncbi:glutamate synthase small chain [Clostridium pasteurianum DSM 525 = ATCC 6013]|uniref:Glutamate synthase small chain n=1 Tax=Clostridium pasteurianum DSM 525 = ATCC 6013 TaxID=1262449 RepID=A0A0H3J2T1_CLOPA|nr:glutamate synthase subunit beta [Clostridium pasteurianum]AJA48226.1 glutamate synthase small chain [Clostridium pasteurianum DSM 525 = ATCC 6013]AJA52214.1 glutamate synthase small chain [Clostridium pasteurianum DSM 525 = ATCC 6013]AOZ75484.1 glutamate synthase [Clostridium pasteurianum DSM 525 = ATCC 6013]AOZ79279.1 glutamate synthase [Clostridium pasteurianum]ELP60622.1 glutamate synthasesmall subunit [Clostridium pasteurianum DSM 525 = ATCC 6013]
MGKTTGFKEYKRKTAKKRPVKDRIKDYKQIYLPMKEEELKEQGARCMECGTPFCSWGCPLGNLMPDFNDMVYNNDFESAFKRLYLTSNFPEFTGRVCPALCEGACTLGVNSDPVAIKELELGIIEKAFKENLIKPNPPKVRTGKNVAVVGSGPSGLAVAAELNSVGHTVTVFERHDRIGGLLRYGIPDFKLEKEVIDRRVSLMKEEGIIFKTNADIGKNYDIKDIKESFNAVVLCGGSTIPRDLPIEGRELDGIYFAVDFLTYINKKVAGDDVEPIDVKDKNVLVIGGGDTGSDCIGTSIREGAKNVYQFEIMPKPPEERDETMPWPLYPKTLKTSTSHEEGSIREWCIETKKFIGENGKVTAIEGIKVKWGKDASGRFVPTEVPGSKFTKKVDLVLLAMGFVHPQHEGIIDTLNLKLDNRGNIAADENHMTSVKGVFTAGDMRRGQSLVVWAINDGRQAAKAVDEYLMGESLLRG